MNGLNNPDFRKDFITYKKKVDDLSANISLSQEKSNATEQNTKLIALEEKVNSLSIQGKLIEEENKNITRMLNSTIENFRVKSENISMVLVENKKLIEQQAKKIIELEAKLNSTANG